MNRWIVTGCAVSTLVSLLLATDPQLEVLACVAGVFALLQFVGAALVQQGARKPGALLVLIGAAFFLPSGLIGMWGARKVLDQLTEEKFLLRSIEP